MTRAVPAQLSLVFPSSSHLDGPLAAQHQQLPPAILAPPTIKPGPESGATNDNDPALVSVVVELAQAQYLANPRPARAQAAVKVGEQRSNFVLAITGRGWVDDHLVD